LLWQTSCRWCRPDEAWLFEDIDQKRAAIPSRGGRNCLVMISTEPFVSSPKGRAANQLTEQVRLVNP
jgi:hypothetical protein